MSRSLILLLCACSTSDKDTDTLPTTGTTTDDTGTAVTEVTDVCAEQGLAAKDFDPTEPADYHRWEPAGDLTVPLRDGTSWTLSENWSGCDNYLFLPHWWSISDLDSDSWWTTGVDDLIERSPKNTHYFFVVLTKDDGEAESFGGDMQGEIDDALAKMDEEEAAWWTPRLHVVAGPSSDLDGLVGEMFGRNVGTLGFGIDRSQRIRTLGYPSAVEAYDSALASGNYWPYENRLYAAANESTYFNFEEEQEQALAASSQTEITVFGGDVVEQYVDGTLSLPEDIADYDTMAVEVLMECPDKDSYELSNCGAWDYLVHLWLYDEESESWLEMARMITTYHRESHWIVDASFALGWLQEGGDRAVRYEWAPEWNTQPTGVTLKIHLSNQGKGVAPRKIVPLFKGGAFSSTYNEDRPPVEVEVPPEATKAELVWLATGHGMDTYNCAEFCKHAHDFTVGSTTWEQSFDLAGTDTGCQDETGTGTVPNQAGTWWYGRGGWCPGRRVDPYVADATAEVIPGATTTVSYAATIKGSEPVDGTGTAELYSWMVFSW